MKRLSHISGAVALTVVIMAAPIAPASAASGRGNPEIEVALLGKDWLLANAESGRCISGLAPVDLMGYLKSPGNDFDGFKTLPAGSAAPLVAEISGSEEGRWRVWSFFRNLADCQAVADDAHSKLQGLGSRAEDARRAAIPHRDPGAIDLCPKSRRMTEKDGCQ
jgi:hypothetical protein